MTPPAPFDPADLELMRDGALTVRQAAEFSGFSRTELFDLMRTGHLEWFVHGKHRMIPRRAIVELLAAMHAAHQRGERNETARNRTKNRSR